MRIIIKKDYAEMSEWVSSYLKYKIKESQTSGESYVLGLPTGSTPLGVYNNLVNYHKNGELSFGNVTTFNMDEYVNLPKEHDQSYHYFMHENLFDHIDINENNINLLDGMADDLEKECSRYEQKIQNSGGIDLFLGGIGADGHIAFNEPGSSLSSRTRIKTLCNETIRDNARFFENIKDVPTTALTVGVGTVMDAKEVVIMISGEKKAMALYKCIEEGINHMWTVSVFQNHPKVVIVCDDAATSELKVKTVNYFKELQRTTDMFGRPKCNLLNDKIINHEKAVIFSPHPDDDVIGIGGIMNMITKKDNIKVAYLTSGEGGLPKSYPPDTREKEAVLAVKILGYEKESTQFLRLPFYYNKEIEGEKDVQVVKHYLEREKPDKLFVCGDKDPNGTHEKCFNVIKNVLIRIKNETTIKEIFIYKGAWGIWNDNVIDDKKLIRIKLSDHVFHLKKLSIEAHQTQNPPVVTNNDTRTFLERVIETNKSLILPKEYEECILRLNLEEFINYSFHE
jgi:glucosamine-6-phosphate deaminase